MAGRDTTLATWGSCNPLQGYGCDLQHDAGRFVKHLEHMDLLAADALQEGRLLPS